MARITAMPAQATIDRFADAVDFYMWKGVPCARKWPHWPRRTPTPTEKLHQDLFAYVSQMWLSLPEYLKAMYRDMAVSTPVTGRDIFVRAYLNASRL